VEIGEASTGLRTLEAKQPTHYKLSALVKERAVQANWPLVLDAARGSIDAYREQDFTLAAGVEALVTQQTRGKR
jgi:hypothetical protein